MLEPISNLCTLRREALKDVRTHFAHDLSLLIAAFSPLSGIEGVATALGKQACFFREDVVSDGTSGS